MEQSRLGSLIEALANIAIGYMVALLTQLAIFPAYGIHVPFGTNASIVACFTLVSLVRSYLIRRFFNARLHAVAQAMAHRASS